MPDRVLKSSARPKIAANRRADVAKLVDKFGFEMPRCSACFRANRPSCVVAEGKQRCNFCVEKKYTNCDYGGVSHQACKYQVSPSFFFVSCFLIS